MKSCSLHKRQGIIKIMSELVKLKLNGDLGQREKQSASMKALTEAKTKPLFPPAVEKLIHRYKKCISLERQISLQEKCMHCLRSSKVVLEVLCLVLLLIIDA